MLRPAGSNCCATPCIFSAESRGCPTSITALTIGLCLSCDYGRVVPRAVAPRWGMGDGGWGDGALPGLVKSLEFQGQVDRQRVIVNGLSVDGSPSIQRLKFAGMLF